MQLVVSNKWEIDAGLSNAPQRHEYIARDSVPGCMCSLDSCRGWLGRKRWWVGGGIREFVNVEHSVKRPKVYISKSLSEQRGAVPVPEDITEVHNI